MGSCNSAKVWKAVEMTVLYNNRFWTSGPLLLFAVLPTPSHPSPPPKGRVWAFHLLSSLVSIERTLRYLKARPAAAERLWKPNEKRGVAGGGTVLWAGTRDWAAPAQKGGLRWRSLETMAAQRRWAKDTRRWRRRRGYRLFLNTGETNPILPDMHTPLCTFQQLSVLILSCKLFSQYSSGLPLPPHTRV